MMLALFYLFVFLAIFHCVWEGIIAPEIRMEFRWELFEMRDRLRKLKMDNGDQISDSLFEDLQHIINNQIALLHRATIGDFVRAYKTVNTKKNAKEVLERFEQSINSCTVADVRNIWNKSVAVTVGAFIINSGGWLVYVVPVLIALICYGTIKRFAKLLVALPDKDINKLFPATPQVVFVS
jgi:hypothetical protein